MGIDADILYSIFDIVYDISPAPIVRAVRERAQLTQRELADRAGTTQAVIARIELGASNPSTEMLKRLVEAAGYGLQVTIVEPRASDPVVEAYKPGVDKTLLIDGLRKTPRERFERLLAARRFILEVRRVGAEARRKVAESTADYQSPDK